MALNHFDLLSISMYILLNCFLMFKCNFFFFITVYFAILIVVVILNMFLH